MAVTSLPRVSPFSAALMAVIPVVLAAVAGSLATAPNINGWYASLNKPSFNPPNWIFGPVWTLLYVMMAYAFYRVLAASGRQRWPATVAFMTQIVLNGAWSFAFFGAHNPLLGMVVVVALWLALAATALLFWRVDRPAGALMLPCVAWVSYAALLNGAILALN
jgi:tryptophan-rich sensory protein